MKKLLSTLLLSACCLPFFATASEPVTKPSFVIEAGCDLKYAASYPLRPKLYQIPSNAPSILFEYPFKGASDFSDLKAVYTVKSGSVTLQKQALLDTTGRFWTDLSGAPLGEGHITITIYDKNADNKAVNTVTYPFKIVSPENVYSFQGKELNSLVGQLINDNIRLSSKGTKLEFTNFREGWVHIAFTGRSTKDLNKIKIKLNGQDYSLEYCELYDSMETCRKLPAGKYTLDISGLKGKINVAVKNVPMLFSYPLGRPSAIPENPRFNYQYFKRYIFPSCFAYTGGHFDGEGENQAFLDSGRVVFYNVGATIGTFMKGDQNEIVKKITMEPNLKKDFYGGLSIDELFMSKERHPALDCISTYLRDLTLPENKPAYTWIVGKPLGRGIYSKAISAMVNATQGRGLMLYECYCSPKNTYEETVESLTETFINVPQAYDRSFPGANNDFAFVLGNFNQGPRYRIDNSPFVDYKYFLDMQLNMIANCQSFKLLGGIGFWGNTYADDEILRWSYALLRHYCVEGRKDMLSDKYGYTFYLTNVPNSDFNDGLDGWTATPAPNGSIEAKHLPGLAGRQIRWRQNTGDHACVMVRSAEAPNKITTTVKGLIPGKKYTFQLFTLDPHVTRDWLDGSDHNTHVSIDLDNVDYTIEYRFVARNSGNVFYKIFTPKSDTLNLTITDWDDANNAGGKIGGMTYINYVKIAPYYDVK